MYGADATGKETFEAVDMLKRANPTICARTWSRVSCFAYGQALQQIAQLIKADVGMEVAFADVGGWDTHANQGNTRGQLANRMQEFSHGLAAYIATSAIA